MSDNQNKRVFISYVKENDDQVDILCKELTKHGVSTWRDRDQLNPGERWKDAIRQAIQNGEFFIACFSKEYRLRDRTFMNAELSWAIEELSNYHIDRKWFIPVLLSECDIPARNIGGGETLRDIQWVSLYDNWDAGINQIVKVINPVPVEVNNLASALSSKDPDVRRSSAVALGKEDHITGLPLLIDALGDEDYTVREAAANSLMEFGDSSATPALIKALCDDNKDVRLHAAEGLRRFGDSSAIPALMKALEDESWHVCWTAAFTLHRLGKTDAVCDLIRRVTNIDDMGTKWIAEIELCHLMDVAKPILMDALRNEDASIREFAADMLSAQGIPHSLQ